jgi:hypothetical protein
VNRVTFVVTEKSSPDGRCSIAILRLSDSRHDVVSFHRTMDEAAEAIRRYVSQARFSGLDARFSQCERLSGGLAQSY